MGAQILGEVLPYLEISKQTQEVVETVEMPNVTGLTYKEAKQILKEQGLEINEDETLTEETIINNQLPKSGIKITKGTKVILYAN